MSKQDKLTKLFDDYALSGGTLTNLIPKIEELFAEEKVSGHHCLDCGTLLKQISCCERSSKYFCEYCNKHWFKTINMITEWTSKQLEKRQVESSHYLSLASILAVEKVLGIKLYSHQIDYLHEGTAMPLDRQNGKTLAYCIKLALSNGILNIAYPEAFCDTDYGREINRVNYARMCFKHVFLEIREKLSDAGFDVVDIYNISKEREMKHEG